MSVKNHPFRWVPSLQHMAKVKIIETLWRNYQFGKGINNFKTWRVAHQDVWPWNLDPIFEEFHSKVNGLKISEDLKIDLKYVLERMIYEAISWLTTTYEDNPDVKELDEGWVEAIDYFVYNLCFNNFGCVDGRKTLESYVRGKESIGYWVWHELCLYCIEDKIIEFSKKFNWQESSGCLNWQCAVYWYRKIYGELPPDKMLRNGEFPSSDYLQRDKMRHVGAFSDGTNIVRGMLKALITTYRNFRSVAQIVHFQNQLNDDEEFNKLVSDSLLGPRMVGEVIIYLLRTVTKNFSLESISDRAVEIMRELVKWPWIFFIDDWIRIFETNISSVFFVWFFYSLGLAIPNMRGHFKEVLYKVFERIVTIFQERFISDSELIAEAFWILFFEKDTSYLCSLMLKGLESHQRKFVIEAMSSNVHYSIHNEGDRSSYIFYSPYTLGKLFSLQETADQVFFNEEKEFFRVTYDQYFSKISQES